MIPFLTPDFYGDNIVRLFQDNGGGIVRHPLADPPAEILVRNARASVSDLSIMEDSDVIYVGASNICVALNRASGLIKILRKGEVVADFKAPIEFAPKKVMLKLGEAEDEYFYGGGVQNRRFSHKGQVIAIENQNSWTD